MSQDPFDFSDFRGGSTSSGASGGVAGGAAGSGRGPAPATGSGYGSPPFAGMPSDGSATPSGGAVAISRPPLRLLGAALVLAVVGGVLAAVAGGVPWVAVAAWFVAGPAAFATLGAFSTVDTRQRARSVYAAPSWLRPAYAATAVVAVLAVVVTAWRIAEWVGRL